MQSERSYRECEVIGEKTYDRSKAIYLRQAIPKTRNGESGNGMGNEQNGQCENPEY